MNQEKTLEEKLRELSLDDLNKITYKRVSSHFGESNASKRPEVRAKMSATKKGKVFSDEHKAKISATKKGRIKSDETKAKMSAAQKARVLSDEHKAKLYKLTEAQVLEIRSKSGLGYKNKYTVTMLSKEYGISVSSTSNIINRKSWKHI